MTDKTSYTQSDRALTRQEPAGPLADIDKFLRARAQRLAQWVTGGVRPEALIRFALLDLQQNPKLRDCTPDSIYLALLACAQCGLEPGALKGECFLVPFKGRVQFMVGWRGLVKMARRSREVRGLTAEVVRERDDFSIELGTEQRIRHRPARGDRGDVIGAYAVATLTHGQRELEWMDIDDLEAVRKVAEQRGASPSWKEWPDQMARKSVIRRLCKRLPLGRDFFVGDTIEHTESDVEAARVLDTVTDGEATKVAVDVSPVQETSE